MSLILSATSYGNRKLYSLKGSNDSPTLSASLFNSDKYRIMHSAESHRSVIYDPRYYFESQTGELTQPSSSGFLNNLFHPKVASSYQLIAAQNPYHTSFMATRHFDAYQSSYESELETQSPEYDEDKMRMKLQELEKALLDENDDDVNGNMFSSDHCMEIDGEWTDPIHNVLLLHNSPESSSSLDSNGSRKSVNKEISPTTKTPKQLLFDCAMAIEDGNIEEASTMINELRQSVSIQGDPSQRIAAYMVEALAARMACSGKGLYNALKCKEPPSLDRLSAMQVLFEVCPCFRFGFMTANGAIMEAFKDEKKVHIIDFNINQGSQYITLIQTIAKQPGEPPQLRLTGVDDPETVQCAVGGLKLIGLRLEKLAEEYQVPFEFRAVAAKTANVTPLMLECQPGEALVVNFAFQLHHMPDESVSTVNQRDQLLRLVKSMNPKLITVVEQDANTNTSPFLPRFTEVYNYYSAIFESLDATLPRDSQDRVNVEKQCLARDIINIVACEGEERIERYELAGKWRARLMMAGFTSCPISPGINSAIRNLINQYSDRYKVKEKTGALHFGWEDKVLVVASVWS